MAYYNTTRRWCVPSKRAKRFAEELKAGVHIYGPKEGKPLTLPEKCIRSGHLMDQSDHAGLYRYKQALNAGLSKEEARKFSQEKGTKLPKGGKK